MTTALIQQSSAYELSIDIRQGPYGHALRFVSFVPCARRPEHQVRFAANLSFQELAALHVALGRALRQPWTGADCV